MKHLLKWTALCSLMAAAVCLSPLSLREAQGAPFHRVFGGGYYRGGYGAPVYNGYTTYGYGPYGVQEYRYNQQTRYPANVVVGGYRYVQPNVFQRRPIFGGFFNRGYGVSVNLGNNYSPYGYGYDDDYGY
ncbi:MAG: hypothetical protein NT069_23115 [Planctomycetota bacterium]|nr:hypothetical protein [Planctomycetota bacterium]